MTTAARDDGLAASRVLVAIPAFNEEATIEIVVRRVRDALTGLELLVVNDGSLDDTGHFVDFHAEAIAYLARLGYRVGEVPVTMGDRHHGTSMYSLFSHFVCPLTTSLMIFLAAIHAQLSPRRKP